MIEVILRQDVKALGRAGELVRVRPGYARNYLLPQGLAFEATEGNKKRVVAEARARATRQSADRAEAEAQAAALGGLTLTLARKAGEGDRLFGSITAQDLADALAAKGHRIDRRKIELEHPIKTLGTHTVPVRLHHEVQATLTVSVVAE
jgi:large subunit ribosomal protein L9